MAVNLTTPPPALSFSADIITARFASNSYLDQPGIAAVNEIDFSGGIVSVTIKYGLNTIAMNAKAPANVDDSGNDFSNASIADALIGFQSNYQLSKDFIITAAGNKIVFTARNMAVGFNFTSGGTNKTQGRAEIKKSNYTILFKLYLENSSNTGFDLIYTTNLQLLFGTNGEAEAILGDKLHARISMALRDEFPDQPQVGIQACTKSCRRYYFEYGESFGDQISVKRLYKSQEYTVLHGGFSTIAQFNQNLASLLSPGNADSDRFLKQGSLNIYTRTNQPQYLYFFNSRGARNLTVKIEYHYTDGSITYDTPFSLQASDKRKYAINTRFDIIYPANLNPGKAVSFYKVYLTDGTARLSEERSYYIDYTIRKYIRYFLYWSSFGSMDSRVCYGEGESEFELFNKTADRIPRKSDDIRRGKSLTFDSRIKRSFKVATGWQNRQSLLLNADFFLSNFKYRYTGGLMLPIYIQPGSIPEIKDGENLLSQQFTYEYHFDDHAYTEGDTEDTGSGIGSFFFSTAPISSSSGTIETDPTVPSWVKEITKADIAKWNTSLTGTLWAKNSDHALVADRSLISDFSTDAARAALADYATDSDKWDGKQFADYLDQPVRKTDHVKFASVEADTLNSKVYVSGFTGVGFKINPDGSAEFDSITIRKDLNVNVLNIREITGTGGSLAITNVAKIKEVNDGGSFWACIINTDDGNIAVPFKANDIIRCQVWDGKKLKYYSARVRGVSASIFDLDKASFVGAGIPQPGDTVFQFGNTTDVNRQGLIYMTNSDSGAPYLDVLDGINSADLTGKTKVRLGKLNGINDPDFGALQGYGLYGENVYLKNGKFKGEIIVTGGNAETIAGAQSKADAVQIAAAGYTDNKSLQTLSAAQTYADASAQSKANVAQANAISQASTDAQAKADAAKNAANLLSQQLVDGIKIGSRNYQPNSEIRTVVGFTPANGNVQTLAIENGKELRISGIDAAYLFTPTFIQPIPSNEVITLSFWVKNNSIVPLNLLVSANGNSAISYSSLVANQGWTKIIGTALLSNIIVGTQLTTVLFECYTASNFNISIKQIKVEVGNKATDWSPAPEDVQSAIDNAKVLADQANASYANLTTNLKSLAFEDVVEVAKLGASVTQGGMLKNNLIDTDYLKVNVVNAAYINTLSIDAASIKSGVIDSARINAAQIISNGGGASLVYVNNQITTATTQAQADATAKASAAQVAAIQSAANDATTKVNALQTISSADAQTKADAAQAAATNLAYAQAAYEREIAKAYADGKVTAEEQARIAQAQANLQAAKDDAQQKVTAALGAANGYTDTKSQQTLSAAQTYADASAQSKANVAQANAISQASTDAQAKADAAKNAANLLSQQLVDSLKFGGRNLFPNSQNIYTHPNDTGYGVVQKIGNYFKVTADAGQTVSQYSGLPQVFEIGQTYTISVWVTTEYPGTVNFYAGGSFSEQIRKAWFVDGSKWYQVSATFTPLAIPVPHIILEFTDRVLFYRDFKIEKGNKATDWSPTTEEVQAAIDNAKALADQANASYATLTANLKSLAFEDVVEAAKLGTSVLQGGMLKNTLIDTDYLKVNVVNAAYIESLNIVAKNIEATTGTIGGWSLASDKIFAGSESANYIALKSGSSPELYMKNNSQISGEYSSINTKGLFVLSTGNALPTPYGSYNAVGAFKLKETTTSNSVALYVSAKIGQNLAFYCDGDADFEGGAAFNGVAIFQKSVSFQNGDVKIQNIPQASVLGGGNTTLKIITNGINAGRLCI